MKLKLFNKQINLPIGDFCSYTRMVEYLFIQKYAKISSNDIVCDIACGNGFWSNKIAKRADYLVGIDFNPLRIKQAKKSYPNKNISFVVADAQKIPIKTKSCSRVVSVCALEHFPSDTKALTEMRRILKDGSILSMSVDSLSLPIISNSFRAYHSKRYYVHNYFTIELLTEKMQKAGFKILNHNYIVTSKVSSIINQLSGRYRRIFQLLFPVLFPVTLISDALLGSKTGGHKLVIKAEAI